MPDPQPDIVIENGDVTPPEFTAARGQTIYFKSVGENAELEFANRDLFDCFEKHLQANQHLL